MDQILVILFRDVSMKPVSADSTLIQLLKTLF